MNNLFALSNLIFALAVIFRIVVEFGIFCVIFSVVLSLLNPGSTGSLKIFIDGISELFVRPVRRVFPALRRRAVDFSPLVTILILVFIDLFLISTIFDIARLLG
ncbi:MAG TPA: YggT family protein [Kosmotogaceae bacterium]|nr:YggT family protein [Kosmotogaceae bacterium]